MQLILILLLTVALHPVHSRFLSAEDHAVSKFISQVSIWQFLVFSTLVAPVLEELIFRLPLCFSRFNMGLSLSCLVVLAAGPVGLPLRLLLGGGIGVGLSQILGRVWNLSQMKTLFSQRFKGIFYGSALGFGLIHLSNFQDLQGPWMLAPLLVIPQCVIGVFLGFIRLRYGFWWAVLSHGLHNFSLSIPLLLTQLGSEALRLPVAQSAELTPTDQMIMVAVSALCLGVVVVCARATLLLIQEWLRERHRAEKARDRDPAV